MPTASEFFHASALQTPRDSPFHDTMGLIPGNGKQLTGITERTRRSQHFDPKGFKRACKAANFSAHGTATVSVCPLSSLTRGTSAVITVANPQVSRCCQLLLSQP